MGLVTTSADIHVSSSHLCVGLPEEQSPLPVGCRLRTGVLSFLFILLLLGWGLAFSRYSVYLPNERPTSFKKRSLTWSTWCEYSASLRRSSHGRLLPLESQRRVTAAPLPADMLVRARSLTRRPNSALGSDHCVSKEFCF